MMDKVNIFINALRAEKYITSRQKDILDTWNELQKYPFDMGSAKRQVILNNCNYPDITALVTTLPTTAIKPIEQITESDLKYNLTMQLTFLVQQESEGRNDGK